MNVVIYFDQPGRYGSPFNRPEFVSAYRHLTDYLRPLDIHIFFARTPASYLGERDFQKVWRFTEDGGLVQINETIVADFVYMKGTGLYPFLAADLPHANAAGLVEIANDKLNTAAAFPDFSPVTLAITPETWTETLAAVPGTMAVLKPQFGGGGIGIHVDRKENLQLHMIEDAPYFVQEFLDTSGGIPGITDGPHDFRALIVDGEITQCLLRTPPSGSYLANISKGGTGRELDRTTIPEDVRRMVMDIDARFALFGPRYYSADFLFSNRKPLLCELNARPAIPPLGLYSASYVETNFRNLADFFRRHAAAGILKE